MLAKSVFFISGKTCLIFTDLLIYMIYIYVWKLHIHIRIHYLLLSFCWWSLSCNKSPSFLLSVADITNRVNGDRKQLQLKWRKMQEKIYNDDNYNNNNKILENRNRDRNDCMDTSCYKLKKLHAKWPKHGYEGEILSEETTSLLKTA